MADEVLTQEETKETVKAKRELLIFWMRMLGWLAAGVAAPITTFSIKFGLFTEYGYSIQVDELGNATEMHIALNGWGIVSVFLLGAAALTILNEIIDAYSKKYSMVKQCLIGIRNRIIPIALAIGVCYYLKGVIEQVIFCLSIIGISQLVAIPLNPLPQWKAKVKGEEDYSDLFTGLRKLLKNKSKKEEK